MKEKEIVSFVKDRKTSPVKVALAAQEHVTTTIQYSQTNFSNKFFWHNTSKYGDSAGIAGSSSGRTKREIFHSWMEKCIISTISKNREIDGTPDQTVLLILDHHIFLSLAKLWKD